MSLFRKKKEEASCSCGSSERNIKVLGSGCSACHELFRNVESVVGEGGAEYITDMEKVMQYGAMSMPALVVDEKVVSAGKVLKPKQVAELLEKNKCC